MTDSNPTTAQMFNPLCALPLPAELFALAIHPTTSLLALGLASGHVLVDRLPAPLHDNCQGVRSFGICLQDFGLNAYPSANILTSKP